MNTQEFKDLKPYQKFLVREKSSGETYRAMKESDDNAFVYAKGKRSRGYRMMADTFCTWYELLPQKDPGEAWKRRVKKVTQKLETSGLWPDLLKMFRNLMFMDYADRERIKEIERTLDYNPERTEEDYKVIFGEFWDKYPFMFGPSGADWFYLYSMSDANTKSMYFGKTYNIAIKERIKEALELKKELKESAKAGYDVSFQYEPDRNKAWYSEEYRGCGNGHYYLAIDATTALFCEDD